MAIDRIVICNMALGYIGATRINSFDDDSVEAQLCATLYEHASREVLADHPWNFAEAAAKLPAAAIVARPDYLYNYALPVDCISPRYLMTADGYRSGYDYRLSKRALCTNQPDAWLIYTYLAPEQYFDPLFTKSLVHLLASELAGPITEDDSKIDAHYTLYRETLARARNRNSQQDTPNAVDNNLLVGSHVG